MSRQKSQVVELPRPAPSPLSGALSRFVLRPQHLSRLLMLTGFTLAALLIAVPPPPGFPSSALATAAAIVLFLTVWLTKLVPDNLAALILFVVAGVVVELPLEIVFSGFQSPAVWLIFGGLIIGAAIQSSGLGRRIAEATLRVTPKSYAGLTYGLFISGAALTLVLPTAVGRTILLVPAAMALADKAGLAIGSRGRDGLVLSAALGALLPAYAFLPSTAPNVILLGTAQSLYGIDFTYFQFWLTNFPFLIGPTMIVLPGLIVAMFREPAGFAKDLSDNGPLSKAQTRTALILAVTLILWATDHFHGLSPTWIALGCAAILLTPFSKALEGVAVLQDANLGAWLLVAAMVSLGAMVKFTGLDEMLGSSFVEAMPFARGESFTNFMSIFAVGAMTAVGMTTLAAPVVMTSLAQHLSAATGWSLETILFAQVPTWVFFALPHQTPILIIAMTMAGVSFKRTVRLLCSFAAIGICTIVPLHFLWLRALGYFG